VMVGGGCGWRQPVPRSLDWLAGISWLPCLVLLAGTCTAAQPCIAAWPSQGNAAAAPLKTWAAQAPGGAPGPAAPPPRTTHLPSCRTQTPTPTAAAAGRPGSAAGFHRPWTAARTPSAPRRHCWCRPPAARLAAPRAAAAPAASECARGGCWPIRPPGRDQLLTWPAARGAAGVGGGGDCCLPDLARLAVRFVGAQAPWVQVRQAGHCHVHEMRWLGAALGRRWPACRVISGSCSRLLRPRLRPPAAVHTPSGRPSCAEGPASRTWSSPRIPAH
jgi:hypothetical protein